MKQFFLIAAILLSTCLQAFSQPLDGLTFNQNEIRVWRQRMVSGPYRTFGDAGLNQPGDWNIISRYSNSFVARPFVYSNTTGTFDTTATIWTGYDGIIGATEQYPHWQGIKMQCSAFRYLLTSDTTYGNPVKRVILAQVRYTSTVKNGFDVSKWPTPPSGQRPNYDDGFHEAPWLERMEDSYTYTRNLFTTQERTEVESYFHGAASYFMRRIDANLSMYMPNRITNNYSTARFFFSEAANQTIFPGYFLQNNSMANAKHKVWPVPHIYTHRNADGSLGNKLTAASLFYNNRAFVKVRFAAKTALLVNDTAMVSSTKRFCREFLIYSVWPTGEMGEYERNGDYSNPTQGAMDYGAINLESLAVIMDALGRTGDTSLFRFSTTSGIFGTQVTSGPAKTFKTAFDRYANNYTSTTPIYYNSVSSCNKIDDYAQCADSSRTPIRSTWEPILSIVNKYYKSPLYNQVAARNAVNQLKMGRTKLTSAAKVYLAFNGTAATFPGTRFMYNGMEGVNVYNTFKYIRIVGADTTISSRRSHIITCETNQVINKFEWAVTPPANTAIAPFDINSKNVVLNPLRTTNLPAGTYSIRLTTTVNGRRTTIFSTLRIQ